MKYEIYNLEELLFFRKEMIERIFKAKGLDGQKNKKNYNQISKEITALEVERQLKLREYIDLAEKCNIHPDSIKSTEIYIAFKPFNQINTKPEYLQFDEDTSFIINSGCYIEKETLDGLIRKWYLENGKEISENTDDIELFYDYHFEDLIFHMQGKLIELNAIEGLDFHVGKRDAPQIYEFRKGMTSDIEKFESFQNEFSAYLNKTQEVLDILLNDLEFSSRGDIFVDRENPERIYKEGEFIYYEFYSLHFWRFFDELLTLQSEEPELFGNGTEILLKALHNRFTKKYPDAPYWKNYDEFVLKIQQQYFYLANKEKGLRLDLFRNSLENIEFEGGLWHAFQHFKLNGSPMSARYKGGIDFHKNTFLNSTRKAFLFSEFSQREKKNEFEVILTDYPNKGISRTVGFFYDPKKDLYYLTTVVDKKSK